MSDTETSLQWKIAIIGVIGIILGSVLTYVGTWKLSQDQQDLEQQNVAQALYFDISYISDRFEYSFKTLPKTSYQNNESKFNSSEPIPYLIDGSTFNLYDPRPYYSEDGLYFAHTKEISRFDSETSSMLYSYYQTVVDIEHRRQYNAETIDKTFRGENLSETEKEYLQVYTNSMLMDMRLSNQAADKIKKRLIEKYNVKTEFHEISTTYVYPFVPNTVNVSRI